MATSATHCNHQNFKWQANKTLNNKNLLSSSSTSLHHNLPSENKSSNTTTTRTLDLHTITTTQNPIKNRNTIHQQPSPLPKQWANNHNHLQHLHLIRHNPIQNKYSDSNSNHKTNNYPTQFYPYMIKNQTIKTITTWTLDLPASTTTKIYQTKDIALYTNTPFYYQYRQATTTYNCHSLSDTTRYTPIFLSK